MISDLGYGIDKNNISLRPKNIPKLIVKKINLVGSFP